MYLLHSLDAKQIPKTLWNDRSTGLLLRFYSIIYNLYNLTSLLLIHHYSICITWIRILLTMIRKHVPWERIRSTRKVTKGKSKILYMCDNKFCCCVFICWIHYNPLYFSKFLTIPVGKIAKIAICRSAFLTTRHCILSAEFTKKHSLRLLFWRFCPLGKFCKSYPKLNFLK